MIETELSSGSTVGRDSSLQRLVEIEAVAVGVSVDRHMGEMGLIVPVGVEPTLLGIGLVQWDWPRVSEPDPQVARVPPYSVHCGSCTVDVCRTDDGEESRPREGIKKGWMMKTSEGQ